MTDNEKISATAMSDAELIKASGEVSSEKIKAIYPHIVVSGDIDNPYYSIQYYDIQKKTMFDCYGSYKLGLVRKWLEEHFEVIEPDIADFINRLQADKEALIAGQETLQKALAEKNTEIERLKTSNKNKLDLIHDLRSHINDAHSAAIKKFAERLKSKSVKSYWNQYEIDNLVKEMVGDANIATTTETEGDS